MLSTGFICEELIDWIPEVFDFGLFFKTIMDDSEISAVEAPFLLSLVLDEDDNSLCWVEVDCWFNPFLKQSFM